MKKRHWTLVMLMLMVLGSFFFAFKPALAQTGTTVFFSPDPANVYLNGTNSQVVELWVGNTVELNGFDITVTYDPAIARLVSWTTGDFLEVSPSQCFQHPQHPIVPGYFEIICVQLGKTPKTGSGVLLKFTFSGLKNGVSPLTFVNPKLSNKDSAYIPNTPTNGTLNVAYNPTIIKPTTLSGSFDLQGRVDRGGIPVTLSEAQFVGQGPYTVPTTNVSGNNLAFTNVAMDVYTVSTNQARYLNITPEMGKQKALLASGNVLAPLRLLGGNAIWTDNVINAQDLALVAGELGKSTFNADADINGNGKVDIFDLAMVAGNYGMTSAVAYAGWTP